MTAANIQNTNTSNTQDVSVDQDVIVANIKNALLGMKKEGEHNEAVLDCLSALAQSKAKLEELLTTTLWLPEGYQYGTPEDLQYSINLGFVEENLVYQGLIYTD